MKKNLIILLIFVFLLNFSSIESFSALNPKVAEISKIENELFGFDYINEELKKRVERLENTIYGKTSNGDLGKSLGSAIIIPHYLLQ